MQYCKPYNALWIELQFFLHSNLLNNPMFLFCSEVNFVMPFVDGELPVFWWDAEADRCMIIGVFKHGK
jgi:hypothetical protein